MCVEVLAATGENLSHQFVAAEMEKAKQLPKVMQVMTGCFI